MNFFKSGIFEKVGFLRMEFFMRDDMDFKTSPIIPAHPKMKGLLLNLSFLNFSNFSDLYFREPFFELLPPFFVFVLFTPMFICVFTLVSVNTFHFFSPDSHCYFLRKQSGMKSAENGMATDRKYIRV